MLTHLNTPQRNAVRYLDGPLLVLAGAGSGKTRVITHKIAWLVNECGIDARHIAAITFTNKAAREMQERASTLLQGAPARGLTVSTFHALGLQILRQEARHLGYKPSFSILDSADSLHIISEIVKTTDKALLRGVQQTLSLWKNADLTPSAAGQKAESEHEIVAARAYESYQATLQAYQAVDFDDLIRLPKYLFEHHAEVLEKWQGRLRYLLVDEYQDTNACQYGLLRLLAGVRGAFTAVGDDDQAIYAWRGASSENLALLQRDYPRLQVIKLEQNYRSTVRILRSANSLIAHNPKLFEKKLWSELGHGDPIHVIACKEDGHEAETVVMRLLSHKFEHRTRFGDYAILYRGNHQARLFEQALRDEKVPYQISGGSSFFDRAEIKDIVAFLRLLANSDDDPAFIRAITTPRRGIGAQTLERLGRYAAERHLSLFAAAFESGAEHQIDPRQYGPLLEFCTFINSFELRAAKEPAGPLLEELLAAIGYEAWLFDHEEARAAQTRWNNVREFAGWITRKGEQDEKSLLDLTQTIALINILESRDQEDRDTVRLSTLHAAKGLEYPYVFLVGAEEGCLPHRECLDDDKVQEERRLMYVGVTRAQRGLFITYCQRRKRGGEWVGMEPSRFIGELVQEDLRFAGGSQTVSPERKSEVDAQRARLLAMLRK